MNFFKSHCTNYSYTLAYNYFQPESMTFHSYSAIKLMTKCLFLAVLMAATCEAKVKIVEPSDIKGVLDHEVSLFGLVDYQATVLVQIF